MLLAKPMHGFISFNSFFFSIYLLEILIYSILCLIIMKSIHYYFKFQTGNKGIRKWDKKGRPEIIHLSIYYGKWKCAEKATIGVPSQKESFSKKQINEFFSIKDNFTDTYLWIFYNNEIFCFKPVNGIVYDYDKDDSLVDENGSFPKTIDARNMVTIKKHELPEVFANINSNQKYNRMTIARLEGVEELIADLLINKEKIPVSRKNYFKFLSPIEFETLLFLIFNQKDSLCSSFRGSTLKDFDLKVSVLEHFYGLSKGEYWVQVKKKEVNLKQHHNSEGMVLVHLGKTDIDSRILGLDWITLRIDERQDILRWLKEMTFKYDLFDFTWGGI